MSKMDTWFRKHDPRKPKDPAALFAPGPMVVLRPEDPQRTMDGLAKIPVGTPHDKAKPMLDELLNEQPHQFIGYVGKSGNVLDKWGTEIEPHMQPGDSMCGLAPDFEPPMFMQTGHFHQEIWNGRKVLVLPRTGLKADSNTGIVMESPDPAEKASIAMRPGCGLTEPDCDLRTLNKLWTGDPDRHWRNGPEPNSSNGGNPAPASLAGGKSS